MNDLNNPPYSSEDLIALRVVWVLGLSTALDAADTYTGAPWEAGAKASDRFVLHPKAHRFHPHNPAAEIAKPAFELAFVLGLTEPQCLHALDRLREENLVGDWGECNFVLSRQGERLFTELRKRFLDNFGRGVFTEANLR